MPALWGISGSVSSHREGEEVESFCTGAREKGNMKRLGFKPTAFSNMTTLSPYYQASKIFNLFLFGPFFSLISNHNKNNWWDFVPITDKILYILYLLAGHKTKSVETKFMTIYNIKILLLSICVNICVIFKIKFKLNFFNLKLFIHFLA